MKDKSQSPWGDLAEYGQMLDRQQVLVDPDKALIFEIVDAIAANDSRLKEHLARYD